VRDLRVLVGAQDLGSRAAVLRRNEPTRFSSASDDEVGGYKARSARSERSERSNQTRIARRRAEEERADTLFVGETTK
jgi:hypothetical protein